MARRAGVAGALGALVLAIGISGQAGAGIGQVPSEGLGNSHGLRYLLGTYEPFEMGNIFVVTDCPASTVPYGGGADTTGPPKLSRLSGSTITQGGWFGEAENDVSTAREFSVFAICPTNAKAPVLDFDGGDVAAEATVTDDVTCEPGTFPVGGGMELERGAILRSEPFDGPDQNKTPNGWKVTAHNPFASPELLSVVVACLDVPRSRIKYVEEKAEVKGGKTKTLRATCPKSTAVASGGVDLGIEEPDGLVHSLIPFDSKGDRKKVPDDGFKATVVKGAGAKTKATVTAVCVR